jgi:quercetin dioxygenase-like cupin family protein
MSTTDGPAFFRLDDVPWPDEATTPNAPRELIEEAKRKGAKRKFLARGEGGFHSQFSVFPAGYTVPMHSHDHDELIVLLDGSCTMLDDGPVLGAHDSMVLRAGFEYGFTAGPDGMKFMTIRTGVSDVKLASSPRSRDRSSVVHEDGQH